MYNVYSRKSAVWACKIWWVFVRVWCGAKFSLRHWGWYAIWSVSCNKENVEINITTMYAKYTRTVLVMQLNVNGRITDTMFRKTILSWRNLSHKPESCIRQYHCETKQNNTRNNLDCDQSNYSSRIVFPSYLLKLAKPEIALFDSPTLKIQSQNQTRVNRMISRGDISIWIFPDGGRNIYH